jgi:hypothetical protein
MPEKVVRRIDHLILRVNDAQYDALYHLFSQTFKLPVAWQPAERPAGKSGGVFAGNVDFEILRVNTNRPLANALLYGIGLEHHDNILSTLPKTNLPYFPVRYMQNENGQPTEKWTNFFIGRMMGTNAWMEAFFARRRFYSDEKLLARSSEANTTSDAMLFDRIYRDGIVYTVKYNPAWRNIEAERQQHSAILKQAPNDSLGLVKVKEVVVQTPQLAMARDRWQRLLQVRGREDVWQVGDGPALRLQIGARQRIAGMVWHVYSLTHAAKILTAANISFVQDKTSILIDRNTLFGLNVRLIEN